MDYIVDDKLSAPVFLALAKNVWPGNYDAAKTQEALYRTLNITAYDGGLLVGCLRILTDGYYFGTITELLQNIRNAASAAGCSNLPEKTRLLCFTSGRSRGQRVSTKRMDVIGA